MRQTHHACKVLLLAPIVLASVSGGPETAVAQPASETVIEEIIVTARQREESLQDVPATITVFTEDALERAGVQRAWDFIKLTPGVSLVDAAEVGDTQVNIRGINGARDAETNFAFILDGVLLTNPSSFNREFTNLQQIEILKGPQGALYGRNAAAGAVIVTTRKPGDEAALNLKTSIAEDSTYYASATAEGPLGDGVAGNLHFDWRDSDGFYRNDFLNADVVDDFENWNVGGRLIIEPSDDLSIDIKARYGEAEAASITFNAAFALPDFAAVLGVPEFFENVNDHKFVFQPNIDPLNEQEATELSVKLDWDLDWGTLTGWLLYSDIEQFFYADGTSGAFGFFATEANCGQTTADLFAAGLTLPPPQFLGPDPFNSIYGPYTPTTCDGTQFQLRNQDDVSFELRLASPGEQQLRWLAGVYYLTLDREVGVNLGIDQQQGVAEELFVPQGSNNPTEQLVHDQFDTDVVAVFGQIAYDVTEDVELSLALRYDREKRDVTNLVPTDAVTQFVDFTLDGVFTGGAPLNPGLNPDINPDGVIPPKSDTFEQVQPKLSVTWDASDDWTIFGSWGIGFKSGGFNNQGSMATVELFYNNLLGTDLIIRDQFEEETSSSFEAGFKSRLGDGRVNLEAAAYFVDVDDMQFFEFLVGPFGLLRVVSNIDEVEITGAEFGLNAAVTDWLTLGAGLNVIDSEIKANTSRPATIGNKSPYTPDYTGNVVASFDVPVSDKLSFVGNLSLALVGETWFHTVQEENRVTLFDALFPGLGTADYSLTKRDSFSTLDVRFGIAGDNWSAQIFGRNVTDEEYLEEVITAPEFGGSFIHPAGRSRWGVEFNYSFR